MRPISLLANCKGLGVICFQPGEHNQMHGMLCLSAAVFTFVQDTIVTDPFYEHMPPHFGMTLNELFAAKHPTTWLEFERGDICEQEALERFWADGRAVDGAALRRMLVSAHSSLAPRELAGSYAP